MKAKIIYTSQAGGTSYTYPSWWAFDEEDYPIANADTKRGLQMHLATINRLVKSGQYTKRPLYTGY